MNVTLDSNKYDGKRLNFLIVEDRGQMIRLRYDDICYFESVSHYIVAHTDEGEVKFRKNIGELSEELSEDKFIKIHRSYIINIERVEALTKNVVKLEGGVDLPVSRAKVKDVRTAFLEYYA